MSNTTTANATAAKATITSEGVQQHANRLVADSMVWLQANWLQILIALGIGAVIVVALIGARRVGRKLCDRPNLAAGWGVVLGRAVSKTGNFFIVMVAAKLVSGYAAAPPAVSSTITFLFTVAAVFQAAVWARELILGGIEHRTAGQDHATLGSAFGLIRLLVTFALFAIALIVVLDNLGVNVTGLVAGLGVGGIAIGLAAQGIFADLFAALAIIFDKPFRVGDAVSYDQSSGTVEQIGLKSTRIRGIMGEQRIVANKVLLDKEIQNNTQRDHRRIKFALGLIYQTPPAVCARVPRMLQDVVEKLDLSFVRAGFVGFGASSLDFEVEFDSPHADFQHAYDARHEVGLAILQKFNAEGIEFAYPTQTTFTSAPDGTMVMPYATLHEDGAGDHDPRPPANDPEPATNA
ncbi:mechanosensitive ion channel family protein [Sphingomonas donggukensis]|uniref:Small-conductance mechanosensitive channel n=1 Tax=Sphingomonas donggukensis TaxID=2949093 RepID=A0ABY4TT96_9SPHN|nr:mechanosensitive ion channel family protein [Sphingomonas donggukensis]URW75502.1 mechanosensitive ion channel family protein [Sphingomonas donggukensis]